MPGATAKFAEVVVSVSELIEAEQIDDVCSKKLIVDDPAEAVVGCESVNEVPLTAVTLVPAGIPAVAVTVCPTRTKLLGAAIDTDVEPEVQPDACLTVMVFPPAA